MRRKLYDILVNRHAGIRERYHRIHDGTTGMKRSLSWMYLLWLNICYYVFFCRFLGKPLNVEIYEEKDLPVEESESVLASRTHGTIDDYVTYLGSFDVISFDIFDTLILRPFSEATDVFYFIGERLGILDFKRIRKEEEGKARDQVYQEQGHYEVTFEDIWKQIEKEVGIPAETGMQVEMELEEQFCYANPFCYEIFQKLLHMGKRIIIVSDMYLPEWFLRKILEKNGYSGFEKLYVSCEYGENKGTGRLFQRVRKEFSAVNRIVHMGDNQESDVKMAKKNGFASAYYPNVNHNSVLYRAYDMSYLIGAAYRGIVNNTLYNGSRTYSLDYEYGFIYGGLFVVGYCNYIHEYYRQQRLDKVLFLSRDGDILKQVYDYLYPEDVTEYVYWSRIAATKLMAEYNRYDYFRRFLYHKVNQKKTIADILKAMELYEIVDKFESIKADWSLNQKSTKKDINLNDDLTNENVDILKEFLIYKWDMVQNTYQDEMMATRQYYSNILQNCHKVCAVDIGWAGSGAISLSYLVEKVWKLSCEMTGIVAGTNTVHNQDADASEPFLQSGKLKSYMYSMAKNRDIMKKHDLNQDYNVYWELLLASPTRQFLGFESDSNGDGIPYFGDLDSNQNGILEIQKGILDFAKEYRKHFKDFQCMFCISGRDAYAPMVVASSHKERYLRHIASDFNIDISIGEGKNTQKDKEG